MGMFKRIKGAIDKKKIRQTSKLKQLYTEDTGTEYDFFFEERVDLRIKNKNTKDIKKKEYD
jgi:hypothetical protein